MTTCFQGLTLIKLIGVGGGGGGECGGSGTVLFINIFVTSPRTQSILEV